MNPLIGREPKEFAVIKTVSKEEWDALSEDEREQLARDQVLQAVYNNPEVAGVLENTFSWFWTGESLINALRLLPVDEDGNPIPEMVVVRATVMAYPR